MSNILNDKRLKKCAEMVEGKGTVCDVGTDHAYLPAYLVLNNICKSAIAGDIAEGPLEAAKATVEKYGLSEKISVVLSDGLKNIPEGDITDVIIAGMGAETICSIIENAKWLCNGINLILQPMTKIPFLREWLYNNRFAVLKEEAVCDGEYIYTVMKVKYTGYAIKINKLASNIGKFDFSDEAALKFAEKQERRIRGIAEGMKKSSPDMKTVKALEDTAETINRIVNREYRITAGMIYDEINRIAPFRTQDSWDNSGLLVGEYEQPVSRIITALDITNEVIDEAVSKKADMIISHHPVIFKAIKKLSVKNPAVRLAVNGIAAVCVHTPVDMSVNGINDIIADMMNNCFKLSKERSPLIPLDRESKAGTGRIVELAEDISCKEISERLKNMFGCTVVRYVSADRPVKRIAICSGSGGSLLNDVIAEGCDAYITGDVKHDVWIDAKNNNIALFDCGHYHTERIVEEYFNLLLSVSIPGIQIERAESDRDIVEYSM